MKPVTEGALKTLSFAVAVHEVAPDIYDTTGFDVATMAAKVEGTMRVVIDENIAGRWLIILPFDTEEEMAEYVRSMEEDQ